MKAFRLGLASALIVAALAAPCAQEPAPDRSLDRMRAVLEKPPLRLDVPEVEANFKIHIEAIHPMHDIFEKPPWQLPPIVWRIPNMGPATAFGSMPLLSLDLLSIARSVGAANRARDERAAREEVQRAIAGYCAAQPHANTIQICSTSPAIR
jgi:hypothetical protein